MRKESLCRSGHESQAMQIPDRFRRSNRHTDTRLSYSKSAFDTE
jgi:hypothetical protein